MTKDRGLLYHADDTPCAGARCAFLHDAGHRFDRITAFHTDMSMVVDGGVQTMIVTADEPGYHEGPLLFAQTYPEAEATLAEANAKLGLTPDEAFDVVTSSMYGRPYAELRARRAARAAEAEAPRDWSVEISRTISVQVTVQAATASEAADLVERADYPLPPREEWEGHKDWTVRVYDADGAEVLGDEDGDEDEDA